MAASQGSPRTFATEYCLGCLWRSSDKRGPCFYLFFGAILGCLLTSMLLTLQTCSQSSSKNLAMRKKIDNYHFFIEGKVFSMKQRSLNKRMQTCEKEREQLDSLLKNSALDSEVVTSEPFLMQQSSSPKKLISEEYTVRGKLLIAVLSRGMKAVLKAKMIYYTWGMDAVKNNISVHFFIPGEENVTELTYFPHTTLSEAASMSKVAAVFETLRTIYSRYGTAYDWIYLVHDDVYVRSDMMMELLSSLDPKGLVYLGHASEWGHGGGGGHASVTILRGVHV